MHYRSNAGRVFSTACFPPTNESTKEKVFSRRSNAGGIPSDCSRRRPDTPGRPPMRQTSPFSERTERLILFVIGADLLLQCVETVDDFALATTFFFWASVGIWALYTIEWIVRIRRAEDWRKYAFSFIGIVDFLAVLPLWAFTGFDLRVLRAFRIFRLFVTTAKLASRTSAVAKLARAFRFAFDEAGALFAGTGIIVITAGFGMYHLEHAVQPEIFGSVYDGLWWAVITLTTVGYGDIQPITAGGKILATVAMFAGIGVIGSACGIMADALREASADEQPG
ncbi:MAG: ion transporter [Gemmatimonadetes bacterium]|nr:ion transporter [Gemmatimonadota bacterium]MYK65815.1 ion transporter [Gemmatimonadota bacterium]